MISPVPPLVDATHDGTTRRKRHARWLALLLIVAAVVATGLAWRSVGHSASPVLPAPGAAAATLDTFARAPAGVRIRVRVVNTTTVNGLAKRAASLLRDRGFDVVDYEGDRRAPREKTAVWAHTDHAEWTERVLRVLGTGSAEPARDSSRYVDITVLLGSDWKAPAQPFRP